ncbi:MAG TPA: hypothetical protein PK358_07510 [Spirochaetota bacterium]|nr:hypothetical protein [Spirochaetota bacterium]HPJ34667.1 hypothetical protein [Spirochaetota bacterium]
MKKFSFIILICFLLAVSCGRPKGEFAFKTQVDKSYKIRQKRLEFNSAEELKWVYKFSGFPAGRIKLGVLILKKELGWVDILTRPDYIDEMKNIVYGTISDFEPGDYRIMITEITDDETEVIDQCELSLYSDEEELD